MTGRARVNRAPWDSELGPRVVNVQRCCNGCGEPLRDASRHECDCAMLGRPLPDVRAECPNCKEAFKNAARRRRMTDLADLLTMATRERAQAYANLREARIELEVCELSLRNALLDLNLALELLAYHGHVPIEEES